MPFKALSPVIAGLLLAGCAGMTSPPAHESAPPPPRVDNQADCGAERVQDRIGRDYSESLEASIREESGAAAVRVIRPGEAVTLDHRPDRLNVRLDDDDIISEIDCG